MAKLVCAAPGCRKRFEPRRSTARFCSAGCSQRARRGTKRPKAAGKPPGKKPAAPKRTESVQTATSAADQHELVVALRQELETAGVLETFEGQLAVELARRLVKPDSNASSLAEKVRGARAAALEQAGVPPAYGPSDEPPDDDEVTRARTRREEARQAAGLS